CCRGRSWRRPTTPRWCTNGTATATRSTTTTRSRSRRRGSCSRAPTPSTGSSSSWSCRVRCTRSMSAPRRTPSCGRARTARIRSSAGSWVRLSSARTRHVCSRSRARTRRAWCPSPSRSDTVTPAERAALLSGPLADLDDPAEVLASSRVYAGRVWDVRRERFLFGGHELERDFVEHPGAVAVLARDADDRVLLINQYRHPVRSRDWELPAGLLDVVGEDPLLAAQRELAEEADLVADSWEELVTFATSPGGSDEVIRIFEARGVAPAPEVFARSGEEAELVVRWAPLAEVVEAALAGRLRN